MNEIVKSNDGGDVIPIEKQDELRQVTEAFLMDDVTNLAEKQSITVPIASLASLGAGVASLIPALRTVTETSSVNLDGIYTLANQGVGDALKAAKDGNFWGAFKTVDGGSKLAKLQQVGPVSVTTSTIIPVDPATIMMAVALYSVEQKLSNIEEMQKEILDFLVCEKESQIEADVQMLSGIISKYKLNWDNEHFVASNHKMVLDIQRKALMNMRSYQKQVSEILKEKQLIVTQINVNSTFSDMQKKFKYYRMALYTYSLASLLEIMLGGNFEEEYISTVKAEIMNFEQDYRDLFSKASNCLEQLSKDSIDTQILKGLGETSKAVGKFIGTIPVVNIAPVDEFFQGGGGQLTEMADCLEEKAVHKFAELGNPNTSILTDRMQDMIKIYNHTDQICIDNEYIYLVSESSPSSHV